MGNWELDIENIAGFSGTKSIALVSGLNWIFGENATGKSSIVMALKFLNNPKQYFNNINKVEDPRAFLHYGCSSGKVLLKNSGHDYFTEFKETFTSGSSSRLIDGKITKQFISSNPFIMDFAFIDTSNAIMNSIEFNGNIQLLKERIKDVSRIKDYFRILDISKALFKEYKEKKEERIKEYGYKIKEYNLLIEEKGDLINALDKEISEIQDTSEDDSQIKELEHLKQMKEEILDSIKKIQIKNIDQVTTEITNLKLKEKKLEESLKAVNQEHEKLRNFKEVEIRIKDLKKDQAKLAQEKMALLRKIEEKKQLLSNKNDQKRILGDTFNSSESKCEHCLSEINRELIQEHLSELDEEINAIKAEVGNFKEEVEGIALELKKENQEELELQKIPSTQTEIDKKINSLTKEISVINAKIKAKNEEKEQSESTVKTYQDQLTELNQRIINMSSVNEEARKIFITKLAQINALKDEQKETLDLKDETIQKSLLISDNITKLLKQTEYIINELNEFIEQYYYTLIDEINAELERLKTELNWSFKELRINDDLDIEITNQDSIKVEFSTLSDFEKKSISILVLYIMKNKFFPDYPLFVIDEHMNSADEIRCANFIKLIQEQEKQKENHMFLVTSNKHNESIENGQEHVECDALTIYHVK